MHLLRVLGIAALVSFCYAQVIQVTDSNFKELVKDTDEWLLEFYADWCGHCKRFEPKYEAVEQALRKTSDVKVGRVNAEFNPGLAARFFISRLPTLVHIKDHQVREIPLSDVDGVVAVIENEEWRAIKPSNGLTSPFGIFGMTVGMIGVLVKKMSNLEAWQVIALTLSLVAVVVFVPMLFPVPPVEETTENQESTSVSTTVEKSDKKEKEKEGSTRQRKSKRID